jgi:predicted RNase H-like HicB family nuclease
MIANQATTTFRVQIIIEPDDSEFHAYCPALKGLHVSGKTEAEALRNAKDAAIAYLTSLIKHKDAIPIGVLDVAQSFEMKPGTSSHKEELAVACA